MPEEIMSHDCNGLLVSSLVLLMFFVQGRNPVPDYSFRKKCVFFQKKK
jgi:hypothetical protein